MTFPDDSLPTHWSIWYDTPPRLQGDMRPWDGFIVCIAERTQGTDDRWRVGISDRLSC
jgi:hypothetical protein